MKVKITVLTIIVIISLAFGIGRFFMLQPYQEHMKHWFIYG